MSTKNNSGCASGCVIGILFLVVLGMLMTIFGGFSIPIVLFALFLMFYRRR